MAALAEYATEQDAHIVFLPARLPVSDELTGLLTGSKDTTDLKRAGIEVRTVGGGAGRADAWRASWSRGRWCLAASSNRPERLDVGTRTYAVGQ